MAVEAVGVSNNVDTNLSITKWEKIVDSNEVDVTLDKVDEKKFLEFKKMVDYIKENGWEYEEEYKKIMEDWIKPFEKQYQDILNKSKKPTENKDYSERTDKELENKAEEIRNRQPEEFDKQQALIAEINNNWTSEEINKLNEIMTEGMAEVQSFWDKINKKE